jgi:hypothetical protein
VKYIGVSAFERAGLTTINIYNDTSGILTIGDYAFAYQVDPRYSTSIQPTFNITYSSTTYVSYGSDYKVTTKAGKGAYNISSQLPSTVDYNCFLENTLILTDKGYICIKNLKNGDLVKTFKSGFVPINMIGKETITHNALNKNIKNQLYTCLKEHYPEIFETLTLTGCHSILVDNFTSGIEEKKTIEVNGNIYITEGKLRLPACVDKRSQVFKVPGSYNIYHLALENDDDLMNYGIYANGLLVETCSKWSLKKSNMIAI